MKKLCLMMATLIITLWMSTPVHAQLGLYSSTQPVDYTQSMIGGDLVFSSIGILGHFRYGLLENFDFGFKAGVVSESDVTILALGADAKFAVLSADSGYTPIDLSIPILFSYQHWGEDEFGNEYDADFFYLGGGAQVGRTYPFGDTGMTISPYGALLLGLYHSSFSVDVQGLPGDFSGDDNEFVGVIPLGAELHLKEHFSVLFELDITFGDGDDVAGAIGANYFF